MNTNYHPKEWLLKMLRINPGLYSLFSGMSIATAINIYTSIFSADQLPNKWLVLLFASLLTLVASVCWAVLYWRLDALRSLERSAGQRITWENLIAPKVRSLASYLICAICATIAGLVILPLSLINRERTPVIQSGQGATTVSPSPKLEATVQPTPNPQQTAAPK